MSHFKRRKTTSCELADLDVLDRLVEDGYVRRLHTAKRRDARLQVCVARGKIRSPASTMHYSKQHAKRGGNEIQLVFEKSESSKKSVKNQYKE